MKPKVKHKRRGRTDRSRISTSHQVTIPVDVLRQTGMDVGDTVRFEAEPGGTVRLVKVDLAGVDDEPFDALIGSMPGLSSAFDLDAERDAWAR